MPLQLTLIHIIMVMFTATDLTKQSLAQARLIQIMLVVHMALTRFNLLFQATEELLCTQTQLLHLISAFIFKLVRILL